MKHIISDLKSVHSGFKKAKRDYARVVAHNAEHAARHEAPGGFDCHEFNNSFWGSLGLDVNPHHNVFEAAGYTHMKNRLSRKHLRKNKLGSDSGGPDLSFLTLEMNGDETQEDVINKIKQAILDKAIFDEQVSETKTTKSGAKHKKGGK